MIYDHDAAQPRVRQPRGVVKVNGSVVPGWVEFEVENNRYYAADTFRVTFAMSALPTEFNAAWWAQQRSAAIEIFAGFPANAEGGAYESSDLQSLIYGNVDDIEIDPVERVVELHGRDLTALLIDAKIQETFRNKRAWEIATILAQRHGLTPVVTKTTMISGAFYQIDTARLSYEQSEWDVLSEEAQKEQCIIYVKGTELHFEPQPDPKTMTPYQLQWLEPTTDRASPLFFGSHIRFKRSLTVAKGVVVKVQSHNMKTGKSFTVTYPAGHAKGIAPGQASPPATVYLRKLANATPAKAMQYAEGLHHEITQHEMNLEAAMPADNLLTAGMPIQVVGTGMAFDQIYFADSVRRRMSVSEGYVMSFEGKNVSPDLGFQFQ